MAFKGKYSAEAIAVSIMNLYERIAYQYLFCQSAANDIKLIGRDAVAYIVGGVNNLFNETLYIANDEDQSNDF